MKRFYLRHVLAEKKANGSIEKYSCNYTETYATMESVKKCISRMDKTSEKGIKVYLGAYVMDKLEEFKTTAIHGRSGYYTEEHGFLVVCGL